ncbi:MAG: hypothetical protein CMF43_00165 [Legionellales bacterium]|nr:hypothetical protein [Legionellales bacterium]
MRSPKSINFIEELIDQHDQSLVEERNHMYENNRLSGLNAFKMLSDHATAYRNSLEKVRDGLTLCDSDQIETIYAYLEHKKRAVDLKKDIDVTNERLREMELPIISTDVNDDVLSVLGSLLGSSNKWIEGDIDAVSIHQSSDDGQLTQLTLHCASNNQLAAAFVRRVHAYDADIRIALNGFLKFSSTIMHDILKLRIQLQQRQPLESALSVPCTMDRWMGLAQLTPQQLHDLAALCLIKKGVRLRHEHVPLFLLSKHMTSLKQSIIDMTTMRQSVLDSMKKSQSAADDATTCPQQSLLRLIDHLDDVVQNYADYKRFLDRIDQQSMLLQREPVSYLDGVMLVFDVRRAISRPAIAVAVSILSALVAYVMPVALISGLLFSFSASAAAFSVGRMIILIFTGRQLNLPLHHLMHTALSTDGEWYEVVASVAPSALYLLAPLILPSQYAASMLIYVKDVAMRAAYSSAASCARVIQYLREFVLPLIGERKNQFMRSTKKYHDGDLKPLASAYSRPVGAVEVIKGALSITSGELTEAERSIWNTIQNHGTSKCASSDIDSLQQYVENASLTGAGNHSLIEAAKKVLDTVREVTVTHDVNKTLLTELLPS